jgi:hypothetical protein
VQRPLLNRRSHLKREGVTSRFAKAESQYRMTLLAYSNFLFGLNRGHAWRDPYAVGLVRRSTFSHGTIFVRAEHHYGHPYRQACLIVMAAPKIANTVRETNLIQPPPFLRDLMFAHNDGQDSRVRATCSKYKANLTISSPEIEHGLQLHVSLAISTSRLPGGLTPLETSSILYCSCSYSLLACCLCWSSSIRRFL